jgi:MFS family permease
MHYATAGRLVSSIGDGFALVAFPLLALGLTHSPVLISGVELAVLAPWLLFGLAAGAYVDRVSRRRLLTTVEVARMVVMLLLAVAIATHHLALAEIYLAAFLITSFETLFDSASMAVVPQLVGDGDLVRANSRLSTAQLTGSQFIGPALGGIAFAAVASLPAVVDGVSFGASAAFLTIALMPAYSRGRHARRGRRDDFALVEPTHAAIRHSFFEDIRVGLRWLFREPRLRLVAGLIPCYAFCQALGLAILVVYCSRVLHLSGAGFGFFVAVVSSGNAIGAWLAPNVQGRLQAGRTLALAGATGGAALLAVGLTSSLGAALVAMWVEAVAVGVGTVTQLSLRQRLVPLELAGRVSSAMRTSTLGAAAIGTLVGGGLAALMGPHAPFAIGGALQVVVALALGTVLIRRLAAEDRGLVDVTQAVEVTEEPTTADLR